MNGTFKFNFEQRKTWHFCTRTLGKVENLINLSQTSQIFFSTGKLWWREKWKLKFDGKLWVMDTKRERREERVAKERKRVGVTHKEVVEQRRGWRGGRGADTDETKEPQPDNGNNQRQRTRTKSVCKVHVFFQQQSLEVTPFHCHLCGFKCSCFELVQSSVALVVNSVQTTAKS